MTKLLVCVAVLAVALTSTAAALAWRTPTKTDRTLIQQAYVRYYTDHGQCATANDHCGTLRLTRIRISSANPTFAIGSESVHRPQVVQPEGVLLHKKFGTWRVTDIETYGLGCNGNAPKNVRVDLELFCTGGK